MEDIHPKSQSGRFKYTMKYPTAGGGLRSTCVQVVHPLLRDVKDSVFQHFQDFDDLRRRMAQTSIIFETFFDGQELRTC